MRPDVAVGLGQRLLDLVGVLDVCAGGAARVGVDGGSEALGELADIGTDPVAAAEDDHDLAGQLLAVRGGFGRWRGWWSQSGRACRREHVDRLGDLHVLVVALDDLDGRLGR